MREDGPQYFILVCISGLLSLTSIEGMLLRPLKKAVASNDIVEDDKDVLSSDSNANLSVSLPNDVKCSSDIHKKDAFYIG